MNLDPNPLDPVNAPDEEGALPAPGAAASAPANDDTTGLPGFQTWQQVYLLVCIVFVVYVVLLTALSRAFS